LFACAVSAWSRKVIIYPLRVLLRPFVPAIGELLIFLVKPLVEMGGKPAVSAGL
jgi:hypothetical protein